MKSVVMIGGGIQQVEAVRRIQSWGYKVIVTDKNPESPCRDLADEFINKGAADINGIAEEVRRLSPNGVFTLINQAYSTACIAKQLGLPTVDPFMVRAADDKMYQKVMFKAKGIPTPKFDTALKLGDVGKALDSWLQFPFVMKVNTTQTGGAGVRIVKNKQEVADAWPFLYNGKPVILEEYIEGQFLDNQLFVGELHGDRAWSWAGNCDSYFIQMGNPIEIRNISPSWLPDEIVQEAYRILTQCAEALGITWGPVAGDFVYKFSTSGWNLENLYVIEVTPRLHGPHGTLWCMNSAGWNSLQYLVQTACGEEPDPSLLLPNGKIGITEAFIEPVEVPKRPYIIGSNQYPESNYNTIRTAVFIEAPDIITGMEVADGILA